jgi:ligand-binding sensor domain-containing protein
MQDENVSGIVFGPGDVRWMWSHTGVIRHDPAGGDWTVFTADDHPALEDVNLIYVTSDGTVWTGGVYGLARYDGGAWSAPPGAGDPPPQGEEGDVNAIDQAPDGSLWAAVYGDLYHLDDGQWSHFQWPDGWIGTMAVGPDGAVWVGQENLGRFDPSSDAWQTFTPADGLVSSPVHAIYVTDEGVVWIGTDGGVSRYAPGE